MAMSSFKDVISIHECIEFIKGHREHGIGEVENENVRVNYLVAHDYTIIVNGAWIGGRLSNGLRETLEEYLNRSKPY